MNQNSSYFISPAQFGAVGDGKTDDTYAIKESIQATINTNSSLRLEPNKVYRITQQLKFSNNSSVHIFSNASGNNKAQLLFDIKNKLALDFQGIKKGTTKSLSNNVKSSSKFIKPSDMSHIKNDYLCEMMSTKSWYHDPRPPANPPVRWVGYNMGKAQDGTKSTITLSDKFKAPKEHIVNRPFTMLSGNNKSYSVTVIDFDEDTKKATFSPSLKYKINKNDEYIFPQAFKGELNVVQRTQDEYLELRNMIFDGYDVEKDSYGAAKEKVSLDFFDPISVIIENVDFNWKNHSGDKSQFEMLRVKYGVNCIFRNVSIKNASRIAFQVERCFNTIIEHCSVENSNNNFLGYGVNVQNSTDTTVKNSWFWGCRRGVDFDSVRDFGSAYPSRLGLVDSCTNYGGGVRQESRKYEAPWYPEGNWDSEKSRNFGFGSHGPAEHITYINNTIINTYRGIFSRGTNERMINNKFIGKMEECIGIWFGGNHTIEGNEYIHPSISGQLDNKDNYRETQTFDNNNSYIKDFPKRFIGLATLNHSPTNYQRGFITIRNNTVRAISEDFLYHQWSAGKYLEDVSIENNHIILWPEIEDTKVHLFNSNHSGELRNYIDKNNHIIVKNGVYTPYRFRNILTKSCTIIPEDLNERIHVIQSTEEITTKSSFNETNKPSSKQGVKLVTSSAKPYSKLSKFKCSLSTNITLNESSGHFIIALFRGLDCIFTKLVHCPDPNVPVNVNFDYIDHPVSQNINYSVRIANISGENHKIIANPSIFSLGGTNKTQFIIQEL